MTIRYKVVKIASPGVKGGGEYRYYPRIYGRKKININDLADHISSISSQSRGDVLSVLTSLSDELPRFLLDNCSVQLGEFGTFSLHASVLPSATPKEVNKTKIKGIKLAFLPGKTIKKKLEVARFTIQKK